MNRLVLAVSTLALGCASSQPLGPIARSEQFVIAVHACVPSWLPLADLDMPLQGSTMYELRASPSDYGLSRDDVDCVIRAGADCGAVRECVGLALFADDRCEGGGSGCDGDAVAHCVPGDPTSGRPAVRGVRDCGRVARVCNPSTLVCDDPCFMGATQTCAGLDAVVTGCPGHQRRAACSSGASCDASTGACQGTGARCTTDGCDDDVPFFCDGVNGRQIRGARCTEYDAHCTRDELGTRCAPNHTDCALGARAGCNGDDLFYCDVSGAFTTYDCLAHGFGACVLDPARGAGRCTATGRTLF